MVYLIQKGAEVMKQIITGKIEGNTLSTCTETDNAANSACSNGGSAGGTTPIATDETQSNGSVPPTRSGFNNNNGLKKPFQGSESGDEVEAFFNEFDADYDRDEADDKTRSNNEGSTDTSDASSENNSGVTTASSNEEVSPSPPSSDGSSSTPRRPARPAPVFPGRAPSSSGSGSPPSLNKVPSRRKIFKKKSGTTNLPASSNYV